MDNIGRLAGINGCLLVNSSSGALTGKKFDYLVAQEDTVISVLTGKDAGGNTGYDFKTVQNVASIKAGAVVTIPKGYLITAITITSGSVICY
jgi:hypothetical protein